MIRRFDLEGRLPPPATATAELIAAMAATFVPVSECASVAKCGGGQKTFRRRKITATLGAKLTSALSVVAVENDFPLALCDEEDRSLERSSSANDEVVGSVVVIAVIVAVIVSHFMVGVVVVISFVPSVGVVVVVLIASAALVVDIVVAVAVVTATVLVVVVVVAVAIGVFVSIVGFVFPFFVAAKSRFWFRRCCPGCRVEKEAVRGPAGAALRRVPADASESRPGDAVLTSFHAASCLEDVHVVVGSAE